MNGKFLVGAVAVIAVGYAATVALKDRDVSAATPSASVPKPRMATTPPSRVVPAATSKQARTVAMTDAGEVALLAHVDHKYRFLLADVSPENAEELRRRLLERESEVSLVARERMDAQIGQLLSGDKFAYYQTLKDSDLEQHHLAEYTGGISNVAPLDEHQERVVLDAKLRQKQRYATAMRDIGLERDALSATERSYAHQMTVQALRSYRDEFLSEVAPALTPEQFLQLKNYETTEFSRELSRLQQKINAK